MSEFNNLINYLKIARRSKELEENITNVLANILDENSVTAVESIEKAQLNNPQLYKVLDDELEFHSMLYLSVENNERVYYKQFLIYNPIGEPFIKYRKLFEMPLLTLTDTNFISIRIEANQGYYYDTVNNRVIELHLEQVFPLSDFCEYHPEELSGVTNGEHRFDYKDEKGNNTAWDIAFSPIFKDYRLNRRVVDFEKKMTAGYLYLFPLIKKESSESYVLNYYYRKKGDLIHFLEEESSPAITLRFSYIGSCLAFLNHTIFYFMDTDDGFETAIRKKFFSQYKKMVYDKLNSLQNLPLADTLEILYFIPRGLLSIINKEFLWSTAEKAIDGTLTNMGTDSEDIILTILTALSTKETADEFLNRFLKVRRGKKTLFALLYEKMNGTNFVKLIKLFRNIWLTSSFIDISNKVFSKSDGPLLLPYKSDKFIGFFGSNKNFDFLSNDFIEVTADEHWIDELGSVIHKEIGDGLNELFEDQTKFKYHPFQAIYLTEVIKESPLELPKLLPAFFLKANEDKAFWSNVITAVEYTVDVVTTLSGVGNLAKFRYLARLGEAGSLIAKIKLGAGIVEITSGVTNTLLKLTGFEDTETGKALQEYLFYLELLSLSGELTVAIKNGLQNSAKKLVEKTEDLSKLEKQLDDLVENGQLPSKQADEVVGELRRVAEEAGSTKFITKGKHLDDFGKLKAVSKYEEEIRKLDFEDARFFDDEGKVLSGSFSQNKKQSVTFADDALDEVIKKAGNNSSKVILSHNHPTSTAISAEDIKLVFDLDFGGIRAIAKDGSNYFVKKIGNMSYVDFYKTTSNVAKKVRAENPDIVKKAVLDKNSKESKQLAQLLVDGLIEELVKLKEIEYIKYQ